MSAAGGPPSDLTAFLAGLRAEGGDADSARLDYVLRELRGLAAAEMRRQRPGHTLQPTALVNVAYLRLFEGAPQAWKDRGHFFTVAAKAMRQVLVDHARARLRQKRGGGRAPQPLEDAAAPVADPDGAGDREVLDVDGALAALAAVDARKAQVVELRYFGGFEMADIAEMLDVSKSSVEREWRSARAWLAAHLSGRREPGG